MLIKQSRKESAGFPEGKEGEWIMRHKVYWKTKNGTEAKRSTLSQGVRDVSPEIPRIFGVN